MVKTLRYLRNTGNYAVRYKARGVLPHIYVDASHHTHIDAKGHACIIVELAKGGGYVFMRSAKIKTMTKSSTESEQYVTCEGAALNRWLKSLLKSLKVYVEGPTKLLQDNQSTITMMDDNSINFWRNKHTLALVNYTKEEVQERRAVLVYIPTEEQPADMGTKPLAAKTLFKHMKRIGLESTRDSKIQIGIKIQRLHLEGACWTELIRSKIRAH